MSLKLDLLCTYCSQILERPVQLPCSDTICGAHLLEKSVLKEDRFCCPTCHETHTNMRDNPLVKPNKAMQKLLDNERHLSGEERALKASLETGFAQMFELCEQFEASKVSLDADCHEHFAEIRRQIDVRREELKLKVDKIALAMIDEVKRFESKYATNLNGRMADVQLKHDAKSVQRSRDELIVMLRDANLVVKSMEVLMSRQQEAMADLNSKLIEMTQIRYS